MTLVGPVDAPLLHVMSFNVRRRLPSFAVRPADRWTSRAPRIAELLRRERPTILGAQEVLPSQATTITAALGERYRSIGHGRDAQKRGEGSPLFFDAGRLELLDGRQDALSDTPEVAGSRTWGNPFPRTVVQAVFRDRATSAVLTVVHTHLDPVSARSRLRSVAEIRRRVDEAGTASVVLGDLNAPGGSRTIRALLEGERLRDAWWSAEHRLTPEWDTFSDYRAPRARGRRIDWIAVSRDVVVETAGVNANRYRGGWPSDHLPVQAVLRLPSETAS